MVITRLIGGLGNQMFQYAVARSIALQHNTKVFLDISAYKSYSVHQGYELDKVFQGNFEIASNSEIKQILGFLYINNLKRFTSRQPFLGFSDNYVKEPSFNFWSGVRELQEDCYISGYWQSEEYFKDVSEKIKEDFLFKPFVSESNLKLAEEIRFSEYSVSVHVRRGDYVKNSKAFLTHGLCSPSYYQSAIEYFLERKRYVNFYVFSDDIEWAKSNIKVKGSQNSVSYISHNKGAESFNDMALMSLCNSNIIANSTFSWWAAWLNKNHNKEVVCPSRWFADGRDTSSLIPKSWLLF